MAADAYDAVARELRALVETRGPAVLGERRRLVGLLLDHLPDLRREIRAVATALDEGVASALASVDRPLAGLTIDRQSARLEEEAALRPEVARCVTRAIAHALGLGPPPGVYAAPTPSRPMPPPAPVQPPVRSYDHRSAATTSGPLSNSKTMRAAIIGGALAIAGAVVLVPKIVPTTPVPAATPTVAAGPGRGGGDAGRGGTDVDARAGYAGELMDFRVPAQKTLQANVGSPTPLDIPVGRRVTTDDVRAIASRDKTALLIDVLANPHPQTIEKARYLAQAGSPGTLKDSTQAQLAGSLAALTHDRKSVPLIFFCAGAQCWESYNAALRAHALGYSDIRWYRGGLASWSEARLPMQATPAPQDAVPPQ